MHALDLYKGDLLEEWDVEWCRLEREELRTRYVHTLHALSDGFEQRGRHDLATLYARRAAQADPLNEVFQRSLMRLLYRTGDKASAVTEFNRFAHLAKSELGVEPDRETIALAREIRQPSSPSRSSEPLKSLVPISIRPEKIPLVGRDIERLELNALLETAVSARGGGVLLVGEAGIGKSKLADWVMEEWAARGGAAGRGRCIEFNDPVPYQPLLDALGSFVDEAELSGFVSGDGRPTAQFLDETVGRNVGQPTASETLWPPGKLRLFACLRAYLEDASRRRPLLAVIEDLQWADTGTVDFLAYLVERAKDMRVAVLLTSRPSGATSRHRSHLDRLSRACRATLRLGPLSMPETTRLVHFLLERSEAPAALARWVHAETEGNPLFVVETLRLLQRHGNLEAVPVKASGGAGWSTLPDKGVTIPEAVQSTVEQRLALVDPASLRIAQIASVVGRSFDEDLLSMVVGARRNRLSQSVGQLLREGIFEREGSGYRFSHDKIRAVCYESLPTRARRTYHGRAAAALLRTPDVSIHRLAWHQYSAGQWNLASSSWEQAGDRARDVHAYEETLGAYGHAISCVRHDTTVDTDAKIHSEIGLLAKFDEVLAILGRPKERRDVLNQMGGLCDQSSRTSHRTVWLTRRAFLEEHLGNFGTAARLARRAWILARSDGDRSAETEALGILAWTLNRSGRRDRSLWVSRLALKRLGGVRSPLVVTLLCQVAGLHIRLSDYASAASYIERAKSISVELGLVTEHHLVIMMGAMLDKFTGDLEAAQSGMRSVLRFADEAGDAVTTARVTFQLSSMDAYAGRLGDALRGLRRATVASRSAGYGRTYLGCLNEVACGIGRLIGNYEWSWKAAAHFQRLAQTSGSRTLQAMLRDSQAQILLEKGRLDEAMRAICEVIRLYKLDGPSTGPYLEALARRGAILLEVGDYRAALADLE
ncbi:MAG TPA: AAA family ATPase, partial [Nitrospiraceae bacterium]|nr:AAA family ATPase [Nitrospiraceae bacterium]